MPMNNSDEDEADREDDPDDDGYIPCPHCGESMLEDAEYCPSCDQWITDSHRRSQPLWIVIGIAVCLGIALTWIVRGN